MSNLINKVKDKVSNNHSGTGQNNTNPEPIYSIQPHPNKPNDPENSNTNFQDHGAAAAHHARGPHIPSQEVRNNLEQPTTGRVEQAF
ncbi:hypothetical protein MPER_02078 [Moniliophthora perniciosa FA553]|nr:hypothetical protein MPER_02078 [Moniliophthora perniciosa FA553]